MPVGKNIIIFVISVCYCGVAQGILQDLDIFSCFTEKIIRETGKKELQLPVCKEVDLGRGRSWRENQWGLLFKVL